MQSSPGWVKVICPGSQRVRCQVSSGDPDLQPRLPLMSNMLDGCKCPYGGGYMCVPITLCIALGQDESIRHAQLEGKPGRE